MASIRQRKLDQPQISPSSRGALYKSDEELEFTHQSSSTAGHAGSDMDSFDAYYRSSSSNRPAIMIPDKKYNDYMLGRSTKRKEERVCPDSRTCAGRCVGFSWIAIAFLIWAGFLIDNQPIFIKGVMPQNGCLANAGTSCRIPAASRAYQAAFAYFITVCLCVAYRRNGLIALQARVRRYQRRKGNYQDIPDNGAHGLPSYHHRSHQSGGGGVWNRLFITIRNMMGAGGRTTTRNKRRSE